MRQVHILCSVLVVLVAAMSVKSCRMVGQSCTQGRNTGMGMAPGMGMPGMGMPGMGMPGMGMPGMGMPGMGIGSATNPGNSKCCAGYCDPMTYKCVSQNG
ncbi:hypothetical protein SNE40_013355 [Patella caerulea]|uniref:Uncharacterized protein n=1 Tax=Patella caerulea TaxID=87958 RepID=A0AAN8PL46_PATCE